MHPPSSQPLPVAALARLGGQPLDGRLVEAVAALDRERLERAAVAHGRDEGVKERSVVVVGVDGSRYLVAAITTKGEGRKNAIPIPDEIARTAGLVPGSAIVVSEFNRFTWPGFDIRPLMKQPGYIAGRLPPRFTAKIIDAIGAWGAAAVDRD